MQFNLVVAAFFYSCIILLAQNKTKIKTSWPVFDERKFNNCCVVLFAWNNCARAEKKSASCCDDVELTKDFCFVSAHKVNTHLYVLRMHSHKQAATIFLQL